MKSFSILLTFAVLLTTAVDAVAQSDPSGNSGPVADSALAPASAASPAPGGSVSMRVVDGKIGVYASGVQLGPLLQLLDSATGFNSRIAKEAAAQRVSVQFDGLSYDAAIRRVFQGIGVDYILVSGEGVIVTALARRTNDTDVIDAAAAPEAGPQIADSRNNPPDAVVFPDATPLAVERSRIALPLPEPLPPIPSSLVPLKAPFQDFPAAIMPAAVFDF